MLDLPSEFGVQNMGRELSDPISGLKYPENWYNQEDINGVFSRTTKLMRTKSIEMFSGIYQGLGGFKKPRLWQMH